MLIQRKASSKDEPNSRVTTKRFYYKSKALMKEVSYLNGKKHGTEKWYYESGALEYETAYANGK